VDEEELRVIVKREIKFGDRDLKSPVSVAKKIADQCGMLGLTTIVRLVIEERARD
jgi:hypothetical protein